MRDAGAVHTYPRPAAPSLWSSYLIVHAQMAAAAAGRLGRTQAAHAGSSKATDPIRRHVLEDVPDAALIVERRGEGPDHDEELRGWK